MYELTMEEIKSLIIIGFNLHYENGRNILSKKETENLIDTEVEKFINKKQSN